MSSSLRSLHNQNPTQKMANAIFGLPTHRLGSLYPQNFSRCFFSRRFSKLPPPCCPPQCPPLQHSSANPTQKNGALLPTNPPPFFCLPSRTLKKIIPNHTVTQGIYIIIRLPPVVPAKPAAARYIFDNMMLCNMATYNRTSKLTPCGCCLSFSLGKRLTHKSPRFFYLIKN